MPDPCWHCATPEALHHQAWDDEAAVVFDDSTGHTHRLDALGGELLLQLQLHGAADAAALTAALAHRFAPGTPAAQRLPAVQARLQTLHGLALIDAAPHGRAVRLPDHATGENRKAQTDRPPVSTAAASAAAPLPRTMRVASLPPAVLAGRLANGALRLQMGPFVACIRSPLPAVAQGIALAYRDCPLAPDGGFADFHVDVLPGRGPRQWLRPQARFFLDGKPSMPLPVHQAFAMLEWGLNWCVASHAHQFLVIHAAVLERHGRALLLSAESGAGKSTLCAALVHRGWRLLSDELALLDMATGLVHGMARPVNLKNQAIDVIRHFAPAAVLTPEVSDTIKGTVALMRPPADSVQRMHQPARPAWLVQPRYLPGAAATLQPLNPADMFMQLAGQSFNYDVHGRDGFSGLGELVGRCSCHRFDYGRLPEAVALFEALASDADGDAAAAADAAAARPVAPRPPAAARPATLSAAGSSAVVPATAGAAC